MKRTKWYLCHTLIALMIVYLIVPALAAASSPCISEITVMSGKNAVEDLEEDGYTVVRQNLNGSPDAEERIYMGYKTGDDAVTGLLVSSEYVSSLTYGGTEFTPVSDINLNDGTDGSPVYLYYTKDGAAGSGVTALETFTRSPYFRDEFSALFGEDEYPVPNTDGNAADLDDGIDGYELYLFIKCENMDPAYVGKTEADEEQSGEDISYNSILSVDGSVRDTEDTEIVKNDEEEPAEEPESGNEIAPGSAIGGGSLMAIAIFLAAAVVIVFIFVMVANRNKAENDGEE